MLFGKNTKLLFALALLALLIAGIVFLYLPYRRDIKAAHQKLEKQETETANTPYGRIEYATYGKGNPVLVVHGIFGGHDQGFVLAKGQIGEKFFSIVPSRFGYQGTGLPPDATPADQADAFASLLDERGIDQAAIMATSAGGTSAIQFALRHPHRCSGLVLVSSNAPGKVEVSLPPKPIARMMFRSDFIFWMLTTHFPSTMHSIMGVPGNLEMTPAFEMEMEEVMNTLLPVKPRSEGAYFDMYVSNPAVNAYPVDEISVPTLIIHAVDDPLADYDNAQTMAEQIPDAKMVIIESGGHPLLGHEERIQSEISSFLDQDK